ncbi:MAG: TIGR01777 family oxidoreductase, partial [Bacteroidota bacterium]|nr:TIGR01777 family oxidoreductase [Bacteroidota bacterium]
MRIVIVGASGLIGSELKAMFASLGHEVVPVDRKYFKLNIHDFKELFRDADVLINLAGAPIIKRWTSAYKKKLYKSRIDTTDKIFTAFKLLKHRPSLYLAASAIGIYNNNDEYHTEQSEQFANDFAGKLVQDWEMSSLQFSGLHNVRTIIMRLGVVLSNNGGAFPKMVRPYKIGLGGRIGNGRQAFSFIHIDDLKKAILLFIENKTMSGVFNLTAPETINNKEFSKALGKALKRPSFFIVPKFILRLFLGKASGIIINVP